MGYTNMLHTQCLIHRDSMHYPYFVHVFGVHIFMLYRRQQNHKEEKNPYPMQNMCSYCTSANYIICRFDFL